jgi:hypothetical protein
VVDVTEIDTAHCFNSVSLDNVILNDTDTFIDSVGLVDVTDTNTGLCLISVDFSSIILNDIGTPVSMSNGWHHPPDSDITLQCWLCYPIMVFDIFIVLRHGVGSVD